MSVNVAQEGQQATVGGVSEQGKDSFGLPVQGATPAAQTVVTVPYPGPTISPRGKGLYNGVRVPVLKDLNPKYGQTRGRTTCRFDIVETVTTVIKPGSYGPQEMVQPVQSLESPGRSTESKRKGIGSRQPTYHSTLSTLSRQSDNSVLDRIPPYQWTHKLRSAREGDARDVLYRNSFSSNQHVRYRTLKLPRIAGEERPWTVSGVPIDGALPEQNVHETGEYAKTKTIVPQQPRPTVVRFHEYMKPGTYASTDKGFEVRRLPAYISTESRLHMVRSGALPLILQDSRQVSRKSERPLKFEHSRFSYSRGNNDKNTLFSKRLPESYRNAFDRDYSSADTFKEYLDGLQNATSANAAFLYTREGTRDTLESRRSIDYHNQALQSVSAVNKPEEPEMQLNKKVEPNETLNNSNSRSQVLEKTRERRSPITVEIKSSWKEPEENGDEADELGGIRERTKTIDELSSVRGSEAPGHAHSDIQSTPFPVSSSVINGIPEKRKSVVPSTVLPDVPTEMTEADISAPSNTPTPVDENETV